MWYAPAVAIDHNFLSPVVYWILSFHIMAYHIWVVSFLFRSKAYDSLRWSSVIDIWLTLTLRYILQLVEHRGSENRLPSSVMSRTAAKPTSLCPQLQENGNHIQVLTNLIAVAMKQKFRQLDGAQNELHPLNNKLYLSWFIFEETSRSLPGKIDF